jgi:branched-chain amino acid transport system ATP-binding protein
MRVLAGQIKPRSGQLTFEGDVLRRISPSRSVRRGIVLVAEGHEVIGNLTVEENLALGAFRFWPHRSRAVINQTQQKVFDLFPILAERRGQLAALLSGGQQQMLAIGRAIMSKPVLMLLDEPSLGLAPVVVEQIYRQLALLRSEAGLSMIIVEQNSGRVAEVCDRTYVMRLGAIVAEARPSELSEVDLRAAYFGS